MCTQSRELTYRGENEGPTRVDEDEQNTIIVLQAYRGRIRVFGNHKRKHLPNVC